MCRRSCVWQMDVYKARCSSILFNRHGEQNTHTHIAIHSLCMWIAQGDSMNKRNWPKNMLTQNPSSNQNYILPKTIPKIFPPKAHLTTVAAIHSWSTIKLSVHSYSFQFSHARIARSLTSFVVCANLFIHHTLPLYLSASSDDCRFVHCIIGCQLLLLVHICLTVFHHFRSERSVDRPKTAVSEQPPKTEVMYSASTLHCHWIRHTLHLSSTLECGNCNQPNISVCAPVAVRTERK